MLIQGASSGLGYELALRYASRQCPVVVSGRREAQLQELVELCQTKYGNNKVIYKVAEATSVKDN